MSTPSIGPGSGDSYDGRVPEPSGLDGDGRVPEPSGVDGDGRVPEPSGVDGNIQRVANEIFKNAKLVKGLCDMKDPSESEAEARRSIKTALTPTLEGLFSESNLKEAPYRKIIAQIFNEDRPFNVESLDIQDVVVAAVVAGYIGSDPLLQKCTERLMTQLRDTYDEKEYFETVGLIREAPGGRNLLGLMDIEFVDYLNRAPPGELVQRMQNMVDHGISIREMRFPKSSTDEEFAAICQIKTKDGHLIASDWTSLDLSWCRDLTDAIGSYIAKLKNLTSLDLSDCRNLTDAIGPYIANLKNLTDLNLSRCRITDAIGRHIAELENLTSLDLSHCLNLTDKIGSDIAELKKLISLDLGSCLYLTDAIGRHIAELKKLISLDLGSCLYLTDAIGRHIAELENLTSLDLSHCLNLTDAIGSYIAKLKNLTSLDLSHCLNLTDAIGSCIVELKNLTSLDLRVCKNLTDAIGSYIANLENLISLDLRECRNLTDGLKQRFRLQLKHGETWRRLETPEGAKMPKLRPLT